MGAHLSSQLQADLIEFNSKYLRNFVRCAFMRILYLFIIVQLFSSTLGFTEEPKKTVKDRFDILNADYDPSKPEETFLNSIIIHQDGTKEDTKEYLDKLFSWLNVSQTGVKTFDKTLVSICSDFVEQYSQNSTKTEKEEQCKKITKSYHDKLAKRADQEKTYDVSTCQWANDLPRKIVSLPSCGSSVAQKRNACVGHVICNSKVKTESGQIVDKKFIRVSTCSSGNCGKSSADECTREKGYSSKAPSEEHENVSQRVWDTVSPEVNPQ